MQRRLFNNGLALACLAASPMGIPRTAQAATAPWAAIEKSVGGRLGTAVLDTATGRVTGHRLDERFPMCSTFKWLAAALALKRADQGEERMDRRVRYDASVLLAHSPFAEKHVGDGATVAELCEAAVTLSDNAAANLLLTSFGGPQAITAFARSLGDTMTRLDRTEPSLNQAKPGDPRDTSTPRAMAGALNAAVLGSALTAASREQLTQWLRATRTGDKRLRAGLPADWLAGNKTGTGARGTTNDVAVVWPPGRAPLVVVAFLTECEAPADAREGALAQVGRQAATVVPG